MTQHIGPRNGEGNMGRALGRMDVSQGGSRRLKHPFEAHPHAPPLIPVSAQNGINWNLMN